MTVLAQLFPSKPRFSIMIKQITMGALALLATAGPSLAAPIISNPGRFNGGRVSIQTQMGSSCSATAPDRASVGATAGYQDGDRDSGLAGGFFVAVPFGGAPAGSCNTILEMEQQRARLDMAVTLFEAGAMTSEELQEIANDVKGYVQGK